MALVEKPRNNLQHHLAWFVSQKPQIPPRGQIIPVKADVRPVLPTVTASQQEAATSTTSVCVTASVMLTQAIHPPSRSDLKPKQLEVENDPFNTAHALQIGPGKSLLTKLRNDQVGVHTPLSSSTTRPPLTRETIDLVSDDEDITITMKDGLSISLNQSPPNRSAPSTVAVRKRPKNGDTHDRTPSQPPAKKLRSPKNPSQGTFMNDTGFLNRINQNLYGKQDSSSSTQIPDSEGEEDDDYFDGDSVVLDSDDIYPEAQAAVAMCPEKVDQLPLMAARAKDDITVSASHSKSRAIHSSEVNDGDNSNVEISLPTSSVRQFPSVVNNKVAPLSLHNKILDLHTKRTKILDSLIEVHASRSSSPEHLVVLNGLREEIERDLARAETDLGRLLANMHTLSTHSDPTDKPNRVSSLQNKRPHTQSPTKSDDERKRRRSGDQPSPVNVSPHRVTSPSKPNPFQQKPSSYIDLPSLTSPVVRPVDSRTNVAPTLASMHRLSPSLMPPSPTDYIFEDDIDPTQDEDQPYPYIQPERLGLSGADDVDVASMDGIENEQFFDDEIELDLLEDQIVDDGGFLPGPSREHRRPLEDIETTNSSDPIRPTGRKDRSNHISIDLTELSSPPQATKQARLSQSTKQTDKSRKVSLPNLGETGMDHPWSADVMRVLREVFHLDGFRKNQLEAINSTLSGHDTFVLMPTGGGKSLCYQLPALVDSGRTKGITIVISPLISLMTDQVDHLHELGIDATFINSELSATERKERFARLRRQAVTYRLLYVTPEALQKSQQMVSALDDLHTRDLLARVVIDEAHCVSQWGHDFRPDYKQLGELRNRFPRVPFIALTATANAAVKVDVKHNLGIKNCKEFSHSFNRPNLNYEVRPFVKDIIGVIAKMLNEEFRGKSGIIYCLSRNDCENVQRELATKHRIAAEFYHAGMDKDQKLAVQRHWQAGHTKVVVATIAFGMGIDKANVRYVFHYSLPKSLEGYYQETGRAGRDGKPSKCIMFYAYRDKAKLERLIDKGEGDWQSKKTQKELLQKVVAYCENKSDCRRKQVLAYFGEQFEAVDCKQRCDNCQSGSTFRALDVTQLAASAVRLVQELSVFGDQVTLLYCVDVFRGSRGNKILQNGHDAVRGFGAGKDMNRGDVERLFHLLVSKQAIEEYTIVNGMGFPSTYARAGRKANDFARGKEKVELQVQATPNRTVRSQMIRKRKVDEPTRSDDDFIDDGSESERLETAAARNRLEMTSRYFGDMSTVAPETRKPIELKDALEGCDDFEKVTANELFEKLVRTRNDVVNKMNIHSNATVFTDTALQNIAIHRPIDVVSFLGLRDVYWPDVTEQQIRKWYPYFMRVVQRYDVIINNHISDVNKAKASSSSNIRQVAQHSGHQFELSSSEDESDDEFLSEVEDPKTRERHLTLCIKQSQSAGHNKPTSKRSGSKQFRSSQKTFHGKQKGRRRVPSHKSDKSSNFTNRTSGNGAKKGNGLVRPMTGPNRF